MADLVKVLTKSKNDPISIISSYSIEELEQIITYTADKYYNTSKSVISDALYDILIDFLKLRNPKSVVLKAIGSKVKSKNKVKLDYWLGSMDKIKPTTGQLSIWTKQYKPPYNLSDKLDGISALVIYKKDGSIKMFTRGTATEGMDITPLVKYLNLPSFQTINDYCIKKKIKANINPDNLIAFRGELIIKTETFNKNWSKKLKNTRNSIGGLVNSKTINPELASDTDLVLYEVVDPFYTIEKQLKIIKDCGFIMVNNKSINHELTYEFLSEYLKERRLNSTYDIDGIIVSSCGANTRNIKGNPEYAFAFKDILEDQKAVTTVLEIEWNISKDGFIIPTLLLKPVNIGGVEIKRVTGNNAKFIVDNVIGAGTVVEIIRSGDVIPKVQKILKISTSTKPDLPKGKWHWNETNVDIRLDNIKDNQDVIIKNIYYFFSTLKTKGLGEKVVAKLITAKLDTVLKILNATEKDFLLVDGFKEKSAKNLMESIKNAMKNISLAKLMAASNKVGAGIGYERMNSVLNMYPHILTDYKKWNKTEFVDNIKKVDGWEDKTSTLLVNNFDDFVSFYESIKKFITIKNNSKSITNGEFTDKIVVVTGFRDKDLQDKIISQGGKIGSTVNKNTNYLIIKEESLTNDKVTKALKLNIKIITKDKLIKLLS